MKNFIQAIIVLVCILPAIIIDTIIYILGGWTLKSYERPSVAEKLIRLLEN